MSRLPYVCLLLTFCAAAAHAQNLSDLTLERNSLATVTATHGSFAYYVPVDPTDIAVLVHGYPWPDDSRSMDQLIEHAKSYVARWQPFAAMHGLILVAPAFGSGDFAGYREMFGRRVDADEFLNELVDEFGERFIPGFDGRLFLYGHSAGGQFAGRYLVTHPDRLKAVVLSAPSTYPMPDTTIEWPYGMAPTLRTAELSGSAETGKDPANAGGAEFHPDPEGWIRAATQVPIMVIVGSADTEPRSPSLGQKGENRIERAASWIVSMQSLAKSNGGDAVISLSLIEGIGHDPVALAEPSQELLVLRRANDR